MLFIELITACLLLWYTFVYIPHDEKNINEINPVSGDEPEGNVNSERPK